MPQEIKITDNVYLHLVPTQQFATISFEVALTRPVVAAELADRALAASMVENSATRYPSQPALARALSKLYGAAYGVEVQRYGRLHTVRLKLTMIDGSYADVKPNQLLMQAADFLQTMLFHPLGNAENGFDRTVFNRQQDNLLDQLANVHDNPALWAQQEALTAYFVDLGQAMPSCGDEQALKEADPLTAWHHWQTALTHDRVDITLIGAVMDVNLSALIAQFPFGPRQLDLGATYQQAPKPVTDYQQKKAMAQSQYVAIFNLGLSEQDRFAALVFNAIFGGLAVSRLFTQVRERAGLAYDIQSDMDWPRRMLMVTAGIEAHALKQVEQAVQTELKRLQTDSVPAAELAQAKRLLIASYLTSLDNPDQVSQRHLVMGLSGQTLTPSAWVDQLKRVKATDVQAVAQHVLAQVQFEVLGGEADESTTVKNGDLN